MQQESRENAAREQGEVKAIRKALEAAGEASEDLLYNNQL